MCGGTAVTNRLRGFAYGLSPRVRGNRILLISLRNLKGSIPACAGEPWCGCDAPRRPRVYPRVCGGTNDALDEEVLPEGLSPRVRGNRKAAGRRRTSLRSIPACAGEPSETRGSTSGEPVYPRVCGGTGMAVVVGEVGAGLSPRVRGNPRRGAGASAAPRSIPACAGEPGEGRRIPDAATVYPRVCGGTVVRRGNPDGAGGLSPRVRGNHRKSYAFSTCRGSIPACAGEPGGCAA